MTFIAHKTKQSFMYETSRLTKLKTLTSPTHVAKCIRCVSELFNAKDLLKKSVLSTIVNSGLGSYSG